MIDTNDSLPKVSRIHSTFMYIYFLTISVHPLIVFVGLNFIQQKESLFSQK